MPDNNQPLSILIVEDNPGDLFLLEELLHNSTLVIEKIYKVTNATKALKMLKQEKINLVLLDLSLPDSSGLHSYKLIDQHASAIPIIVLTGLIDMEIALQTMASGAQDYLIKGEFDEKLLYKSIQYSIERKQAAIRVMSSEERYRNLFFNNPMTTFIWDLTTLEILEVNGKTQLEYGYSREELLNMTILRLRPEEGIEKIRRMVKKLVSGELTRIDGVWLHMKKNGEHMFMDLSSHIIQFNEKPAVLTIANNITDKILLERKLQEERQLKQKEITEAMIRVQEKERYEISRELHDNVNQQLTVAMMYIATAQKGNGNHQELLKQSSGFIYNAIEEIRKLSKALVTPLIKDFGLSKAIDGLIEDIHTTNTLIIEFFSDSFYEEDIKYEFKLNIFRIVQEQMNNILKHAHASLVTIELYRDDHVTLSIFDNGVGFDTSEKRKGIGLNNIRSRAELYNANMELNTTLGKGCRLHISFPVIADMLD